MYPPHNRNTTPSSECEPELILFPDRPLPTANLLGVKAKHVLGLPSSYLSQEQLPPLLLLLTKLQPCWFLFFIAFPLAKAAPQPAQWSFRAVPHRSRDADSITVLVAMDG